MSSKSDTPAFVKKLAAHWIDKLSRPTHVETHYQDEDGQWHKVVGSALPPKEER